MELAQIFNKIYKKKTITFSFFFDKAMNNLQNIIRNDGIKK